MRIVFSVLCLLSVVLLAGCIAQGQPPSNSSAASQANGSATHISGNNSTHLNNTGIQEEESNLSVTTNEDCNFSKTRTSSGKLIVYYFYASTGCDPCRNISPMIEQMKDEYLLFTEWREFDTQNASQGPAYWSFADFTNLPNCLRKIPLVFVDNKTLIGPYEINDSLPGMLSNFSKSAEFDFSPVYSKDGKLLVYYFHSPSCPSCMAVNPEVEAIAKRYWNWTKWIDFNINNPDDNQRYTQFQKQLNITPDRSGVPTILVNGTVLWGRYEINDSLEEIINGSVGQKIQMQH